MSDFFLMTKMTKMTMAFSPLRVDIQFSPTCILLKNDDQNDHNDHGLNVDNCMTR